MKGFSAQATICWSSSTVCCRRGRHVLQEGQACAVNVHGNGEGIGSLHQVQLFLDGLHIPGLDGGHAAAAVFGQDLGGTLHQGGIGAVTGEGGDAVFRAGGHQDLIVGKVAVLIAVVQRQGAQGGGKHRERYLAAEEVEAGVHGLVFADGVHVHAQLLPLLVVADEAGADALGAGAGNGVLAGQSVAHGAGLAVGTYTVTGLGLNLLIRHRKFPPNLTQISCTAGQAVQIYCTAPRRKRQPAPEKLSKRILKGGTFAEKSRLTL